MTEEEAKRLQCENAYLKDRCVLLEASVVDLGAKLNRMQTGEELPRGSRSGWHATLLSSGQ
jgi:hypothetical protein